MGFDASSATNALAATNGNIDHAAELLLAGTMPTPVPIQPSEDDETFQRVMEESLQMEQQLQATQQTSAPQPRTAAMNKAAQAATLRAEAAAERNRPMNQRRKKANTTKAAPARREMVENTRPHLNGLSKSGELSTHPLVKIIFAQNADTSTVDDRRASPSASSDGVADQHATHLGITLPSASSVLFRSANVTPLHPSSGVDPHSGNAAQSRNPFQCLRTRTIDVHGPDPQVDPSTRTVSPWYDPRHAHESLPHDPPFLPNSFMDHQDAYDDPFLGSNVQEDCQKFCHLLLRTTCLMSKSTGLISNSTIQSLVATNSDGYRLSSYARAGRSC
jgi:hypothetical protein